MTEQGGYKQMRLNAVVMLFMIFISALMGIFWIFFAEARNVKEGGLLYWLIIPDNLKEIPIEMPCNTPVYTHINQDGLSSESGEINYKTSRNIAEIEKYLYKNNDLLNCKPIPESLLYKKMMCEYNNKYSGSIYFMIENKNDSKGCRTINILWYGEFYE